jgi:glycosyltransferase involved in cell wall biosynthesis
MHTLSVIIPFFNEERYIEESISRVLEIDIFDQIILSDDCSTDLSSKIAKEFSSNNNKVEYIRLEKNLGKGAALNNARNLVKSTHVIIHDADLEYFPADIKDMFKCVDENPTSLILGSRFIGSFNRSGAYTRTFLANKIMSLFFSIINQLRVTDVATCYKLMPSKFFKDMNIEEKGFSIEIELISKFLRFNKSIIEVPINYEGRTYDQGKKIKTLDGVLYLANTLKYRF